jgi:hypothetical protein
VSLARRTFTFLAASSPAWARVLAELAQSQTFRRRLAPIEPRFQVLGPRLRLEVAREASAFASELERETPQARRAIEDLHAELARTGAAADAVFDRDAVWPPGGFWERRVADRLVADLPHLGAAGEELSPEPASYAFLSELATGDPYRDVVDLTARFGSYACALPPFAAARLHAAWTRGPSALGHGEDELTEFLLDRIRAHGGETRLSDRAIAITHKGGRVSGVQFDGDDSPTGVQFVVAELPMRGLLDLATGFAPPRRTIAALPRMAVGEQRFVVSAVVRDAGIPEALGAEAFLLPPSREGSRPAVRLQRRRSTVEGATLLVAEALLPVGGSPKPAVARDSVLKTLEHYLPFVEQHYVVVDSVHDGRPLWDYRSGARRDVPRALLRASGLSTDPEAMVPRYHVDPAAFHGLAAEPLRAPLANACIVGKTVLPALGQEGELLAAWGAARIITRTDRRKERMRREMWSKVEIG